MTTAECPAPASTAPEPRPDRFIPCEACGAPVRQPEGKPARKLCGAPACRGWWKFLAAAGRCAARLDFPETPNGRAARKRAIRAVMELRNLFPIVRHAVRDETGRFADGVRPRQVRGRCGRCGRMVNLERGCIGCPKETP